MTVQEGEVTRVRPTTLEICMNGAIRIKKKADVGPNYSLACNGESHSVYTSIVYSVLQSSC